MKTILINSDPVVEYVQVEVPTPFEGSLKLGWPITEHTVTSKYGFRNDLDAKNSGGGDSIHFGLDIIPKDRTKIHIPIMASEAGEVVTVYPPPSKKFRGHPVFGGCVQIKHDTGRKSASGKEIYLYTFYAHLSEVWVSEGQKIEKGAFLGRMGKTGKAQGFHLHYEISFDPEDFL